MWRLAIYSLLSAWHGKLTSERPPNISVESLKIKWFYKEVVFLGGGLTMLDSYSVITFGWSLLTGGLCSEVSL